MKQNDSPLVTVGVASFNQAKYVTETLDSINKQTYNNIELLIVDDCSSDSSVNIIKGWLPKCNFPCSLIIHKANQGVISTVNDLIEKANGIYISLIAADDLMAERKIQMQVDILEQSSVDVAGIYSDSYLIKEDGSLGFGTFIQRNRQDIADPPQGNIFEDLLAGNFIPAMSFLYKKKIFDKIGGFDNDLLYEDYDMWLRISKEFNILFSDFTSCYYRIHPTSFSNRPNPKWIETNLKILIKHLDVPEALPYILRALHLFYEQAPKEAYKYAREISLKTGIKANEYYFSKLGLSPKIFKLANAVKNLLH